MTLHNDILSINFQRSRPVRLEIADEILCFLKPPVPVKLAQAKPPAPCHITMVGFRELASEPD